MGNVAPASYPLLAADRARLRELALQYADRAASQKNQERNARWYRLNDLQAKEPMVLAELGGLIQSGELSFESQLQCQAEWARAVERDLLLFLYQVDFIDDDWIAEPAYNLSWHIELSTFGVDTNQIHAADLKGMGSYTWDPPIKTPDDLDRMHIRSFAVDRDGSNAHRDAVREAIGDILDVRFRFSFYFWWTTGLTWTAIDHIGLEPLMLWMIEEPDALHRLMKLLHDDLLALMRWSEAEGLLTPNNENDYIGSGTQGYTRQIPRSTDGSVRLSDIWMLAESQETVGVSPDMFEEFIWPYQFDLARQGGLTYYGCCEPVNARWHIIERLENLRKISVSPWCDQEFIAAHAKRYVHCRKPSPVLVSTVDWNEEAIRTDLRRSLAIFRDNYLELVMKDVHTLQGDMGRLRRWVEIAREEIARA